MVKLNKQEFIATINSLQEQYEADIKHSEILEKAFNVQLGLYNNGFVINALIRLLQLQFPKKGNICEIEHFCYVAGFGKLVDETAEDLWNKLNE